MRLRTHDRYDYVPLPSRADYTWPNGRRLAVYFALNLEHFSYGEGLGAELAPGGLPPLAPDPVGWVDFPCDIARKNAQPEGLGAGRYIRGARRN